MSTPGTAKLRDPEIRAAADRAATATVERGVAPAPGREEIRMGRRLIRTAGLVALGALLFAGAVESAPCRDSFARTELFFGSATPDGAAVTDEDFRAFLEHEITPRFP